MKGLVATRRASDTCRETRDGRRIGGIRGRYMIIARFIIRFHPIGIGRADVDIVTEASDDEG